MPRGVYVRKQEETGYKNKAYWSRKMKKRANFACGVCCRRWPASFLRAVSDTGKLVLQGRIICLECLAAEHFGGSVLSKAAFRVLAWESGIPFSRPHLRRWAGAGLIPRSHLGFLPRSLLTKIALLHHNRSLPNDKLADLLSNQQVQTMILHNQVTGLPEILTIVEEFPGISMDGRVYLCQRLLNGDLLVRSKRKGVSHGVVQA